MIYQTIGTVVNTHGLKGEIKVKPNYFANHQSIFKPNQTVYLMDNLDFLPLIIEIVRKQKTFLLLSLKGYQTIEQVQFMKQKSLMIEVSVSTKNQEDKTHHVNLIDYQVYDAKTSQVIGKVVNFIDNNHQGLWKIMTVDHQTLLVPNHSVFIQSINEEQQNVTVNLIEGLVVNEKI